MSSGCDVVSSVGSTGGSGSSEGSGSGVGSGAGSGGSVPAGSRAGGPADSSGSCSGSAAGSSRVAAGAGTRARAGVRCASPALAAPRSGASGTVFSGSAGGSGASGPAKVSTAVLAGGAAAGAVSVTVDFTSSSGALRSWDRSARASERWAGMPLASRGRSIQPGTVGAAVTVPANTVRVSAKDTATPHRRRATRRRREAPARSPPDTQGRLASRNLFCHISNTRNIRNRGSARRPGTRGHWPVGRHTHRTTKRALPGRRGPASCPRDRATISRRRRRGGPRRPPVPERCRRPR